MCAVSVDATAAQPPGKPIVLQMRGISKQYPGVRALREADLQVGAGEVHVLVGENGAGKSTLVKILSGAVRPDAGEILLDGREVEIADPLQARRLGISTIYRARDEERSRLAVVRYAARSHDSALVCERAA